MKKSKIKLATEYLQSINKMPQTIMTDNEIIKLAKLEHLRFTCDKMKILFMDNWEGIFIFAGNHKYVCPKSWIIANVDLTYLSSTEIEQSPYYPTLNMLNQFSKKIEKMGVSGENINLFPTTNKYVVSVQFYFKSDKTSFQPPKGGRISYSCCQDDYHTKVFLGSKEKNTFPGIVSLERIEKLLAYL